MAEKIQTEELISERQAIEALLPEQIVSLILSHGEQVSKLERTMSLAAEVLEGAYGLSVEQVLQKRESKENVEAEAISS